MDDMMLARFNLFWFLWLFTPPFLMWYGTLKPSNGRLNYCVILSVLLTYAFSNLAVHWKWELRMAWADTPNEFEIATADGANVVFTALFFAPIEAVVLTTFWRFFFQRRRRNRIQQISSLDHR